MKAINVACAVALFGACAVDDEPAYEVTFDKAEQAATQANVWQATWNGGNASASFWSGTGGGYVDAFEYKTRDYRYAYVNFSTYSFDPDSLQCFTENWYGYTWEWCWYTRYTYAYGWGTVSESDALLNPNSARLHTTLDSNFYGTQCTYDLTTWTGQCTPLSGGTIDLRWHKDGAYSQFQSGTQQYAYGPYTFKSQGTYRSSSATVTGTMLGIDVGSTYGWMGDTRGVNVSKSVFQTPNP